MYIYVHIYICIYIYICICICIDTYIYIYDICINYICMERERFTQNTNLNWNHLLLILPPNKPPWPLRKSSSEISSRFQRPQSIDQLQCGSVDRVWITVPTLNYWGYVWHLVKSPNSLPFPINVQVSEWRPNSKFLSPSSLGCLDRCKRHPGRFFAWRAKGRVRE